MGRPLDTVSYIGYITLYDDSTCFSHSSRSGSLGRVPSANQLMLLYTLFIRQYSQQPMADGDKYDKQILRTTNQAKVFEYILTHAKNGPQGIAEFVLHTEVIDA